MKRGTIVMMLAVLLICLTACTDLTSRDRVIRLYQENQKAVLRAAETGDFGSHAEIEGIERIRSEEQCTDILSDGIGFGSGTSYYGLYYSASDDLFAVHIKERKE